MSNRRTIPDPERLSVEGDLWVLHKPAGMPVHPVHGQTEPDLMAWCVAHLGAPAGLSPCHRLDKPTSGIVLASPNPEVRRTVGEQFAAQSVAKTYEALVYGRVAKDRRIDRPLVDQRRKKSLDAVTKLVVVDRFRRLTRLEVHPETGRKHQIRRHLRAIKHPVVGDRRYGWPRPEAVPGFPGRLWLHAARLALADGRTFEAALPAALTAHLEVLRGRESGRAED